MKKKMFFINGGVALGTLVIVVMLIVVLVTNGDVNNDSKKSSDGKTNTVTETISDDKETEPDTEKENGTETETEAEKETEPETNTTGKIDISDIKNKDVDECYEILAQSKLEFGNVSYKAAYSAIIELYNKVYADVTFSLVYFDDDDTPELACGETGYYVSLYTFKDGMVYTLMDRWGYGAGGNHGYEYLPGMSVIRNYNADNAGAVMNETYISIKVVGEVVQESYLYLKTTYFDDVDGNGEPGSDEPTGEQYIRYYLEDVEITEEEYRAKIVEGYYEELCGKYNGDDVLDSPTRETIKDSECKRAYKEVIQQYESVHSTLDVKYDLIDFNGDNVPELICGLKDYYVSMYTYKDGKVYEVMDDWGYGIGGNYGYMYWPSKNVIMNVNSDMGGAIYYTYYGEMNVNCEIEEIYTLKEEYDDSGINVKYYIGEEEISELEYENYIMGGSFFYIEGKYSKEEMEVYLK